MNKKECEYGVNHSFLVQTLEQNGAAISAIPEINNQDTARCEYFSNRTRIKCSSIRPLEELKPFGYCEKVSFFILMRIKIYLK